MNTFTGFNLARRLAMLAFSGAALLVSGGAGAQALEESWRAALEGDLVTVQRLIERGASPDTSDREGSTLLMLAARSGHVPVVSYLLSQKASVNARNQFGDTALMAASLKGQVAVAKVLLENGAELNPPGWTPLHYAAFDGRTEMIKFLLDKGAAKNAVAPNEYTPLMLAVRNGHEEAARALLYGDPDVNYRTRSTGDSALTLATKRGYVPVVDLLRRAGAVE
jgi:ankyrin repeat protein